MPVPPLHRCVVLETPWVGVHGTQVDSARHYSCHWHDSHGLGLIDGSGQRSASGRQQVEALAGDVIATNPGEDHDGRPLGGGPRRWRMLYFDSGTLPVPDGSSREPLPPPVIREPSLALAMRALLLRMRFRLRVGGLASAR